ncbi:aminoacyl-tRNA hydrolase [Candidatus Wolfebacteria bacterium]|nr:MAG: aminoacyl-tRNA hydrolase [Candidatus Wolfebacteria bacterium]
MYTIVGLGNPGEEYENSRHNVGRAVLEGLAADLELGPWKKSKPHSGMIVKEEVGGVKITLILPDTFMNRSGLSVKSFAGSKAKIGKLIVVHDDLDLPVGGLKIVKNRGAGGHKGVLSVMSAVKSKDFTRIRVGIVPTTPTGKLKKPKGEKEVEDFVLGTFKKKDAEVIEERIKNSVDAIKIIVTEGIEQAMQKYNQ